MKPIDVTIIGGGMITHDQILPSVYHLQRTGMVGKIALSALNTSALKALNESSTIRDACPGQQFEAYPALSEPEDKNFPELYKEVLAAMPPRQAVIVAVPDHLHYRVITDTLAANQHILTVKPLVLEYDQAEEVRQAALEKGLFIGIEYHKRFDRRALMARQEYRDGRFGEFVMGEAKMIEPYLYRNSNFQNWFTTDQTDPFVYVGCHYVDQVYFITGLRPVEVSVSGVRRNFPNGKEAFMWTNARVNFENGAIFSVTNGLGYPDEGAGANDQGLVMFCEGDGKSGLIHHDDQDRGVRHSYVKGTGAGGSVYNYVSPDFYRFVPWDGPGLKPTGYGYDSVEGILQKIQQIEDDVDGKSEDEAVSRRRQLIRAVDEQGLLATPANSYINELVSEAARISILHDGDWVKIIYGDSPRVEKRWN
jgi:predicted dehydrogenase